MFSNFNSQINFELKNNQIAEFFESLKSCSENKIELNPILQIHFDTLHYYYGWGYECFKDLEWGHENFEKADSKTRSVTKPFGKLFKSVYALTKEAHALQDSTRVRIPFSNSYRWYINIMLEMMLYDLQYMLQENRSNDVVAMWKERVKCYRSLEFPNTNGFISNIKYNPFVANISKIQTNALLLFIESAYTLSQSDETFFKKYWTPFITAQEEIIYTFEHSKHLNDVKILPHTAEYQVKSRTESGRRTKYSKSKSLSKWLK